MAGGRLATVIALALFGALGVTAAPAAAGTKTIPSTLEIAEVTDDLTIDVGVSGPGKCPESRTVSLEVPGVQSSVVTGGDGSIATIGSDWYSFSSATKLELTLKKGPKFGKPGHKKQCAADTAQLTAVRAVSTVESFNFFDMIDTFGGQVQTDAPECLPARAITISTQQNPSFNLTTTTAAGGSFTVANGSQPPAGEYVAFMSTASANERYKGNGNAAITACSNDFSSAISVSR